MMLSLKSANMANRKERFSDLVQRNKSLLRLSVYFICLGLWSGGVHADCMVGTYNLQQIQRWNAWVIKIPKERLGGSDWSTFYINICNNTRNTISGNHCSAETTSICLKQGDTYTNIGDYNATSLNYTLSDNGDGFRLDFAGDGCPDSAESLQTSITFKCGKTLGLPIFIGKLGCTYFFEWHSTVACKNAKADTNEVKCYVTTNKNNSLRDLSPLIKTSGGYLVNSDTGDDLYINVCRDITPETGTDGPTSHCPEGASACQLNTEHTEGYIMGKATKHLMINDKDDKHLQLRYEFDGSPERCSGFKPSMTIEFVCPQEEGRMTGGKDPVLLSNTNCQYDIEWKTEYACDAQSLTSHNCRLNSAVHGVDLDLTPLQLTIDDEKVNPYHAEDKENKYIYYMNVCKNMPSKHCNKRGAGVCQKSQDSSSHDVVGGLADSSNMTLRYADGELSLMYKGGDVCSNGFGRTSIINFECNKTAVHDGKGQPEYVGEKEKCTYFFEWQTKYACLEHPAQTSCTASKGNNRFDLSPLVRVAGDNWQALDGRHEHGSADHGQYYINICADILTASPVTSGSNCTGSSACFVNDTGTEYNLGQYSQSPVVDSDNQTITLTYTDGDECEGSNKRSTIITFTCAPGDLESAPSLVRKSADSCLYEFEWRTAAACPLLRKFGDDCRVFDDDAGFSFDLNPLKKSGGNYHYTNANITYDYYLNVCDEVTGTRCDKTEGSTELGPGACQEAKGKDQTDSWKLGKVNSTLEYYDGILKLTYGDGDAYNTPTPKNRKTEIAFLCDPDAGIGEPEYQTENDTYFFKWHTKYACPKQPIECIVTNEETHEQYDLSSLSKALEEENWSFVDDATDPSVRTKYYINVCRPINPVQGCRPNASVCKTTFNNNEETISIPNLGVARSRPTFESSGHIKLKYVNGSDCTVDGVKGQVESHVHFSCRKGKLGSSPRLLEKVNDCLYSFIWETEAACPIDSNVGDKCSVKDPNSEYWFNLQPLIKEEYYDVTSKDGQHFQLNICDGTKGTTLCPNASSACMLGSSDPVKLGSVNYTKLEFSDDGLLTLTYSEGSRNKDKGLKYSTQITFLCRRDIPQADQAPEFIRVENELIYIFNFETPLACLPESVDCLVSDMQGNQYDLSPLAKESGNWEAVDTREGYEHLSYHLNVCRPVNGGTGTEVVQCPGGPIGACQTDSSSNKAYNMGYVQAMPEAGIDGSLSIRYVNGEVCNGSYHRSTRINFECSSTPGSPVFQTKTEDCEYVFTWETPAACPMKRVKGKNCVVQAEQFDFQFDLSTLHNDAVDYVVHTPYFDYQINVCGPLVSGTGECAGSKNVSACQKDKDGKIVAQAGIANGDLVYDEGVLSLNYTNGKKCHGGTYDRSTAINFFCDDTLKGNGKPTFINETADCTYQFEWPTPLACPPFKVIECSYRNGDEQYDLSPLAGIEDNYKVMSNTRGEFYINLCRSLLHKKGVQGEKCPHNSAACMKVVKDGETSYQSLGEVTQGPLMMNNNHLVIRYEGGDLCPDGHNKKGTEISIECDKNGIGGLPQFSYASDDCTYYFTWFSNLACDISNDNQDVNEDCTATNPATGHIFDLSSLKEKSGGYEIKGKDGHRYTINICAPVTGKKFTDTKCDGGRIGSCQQTSLTDPRYFNAGNYNQRLSYDDQILSLVYKDGTPCHNAKYNRKTVINFVCPQVEDNLGAPVFIDESDECSYFFSWHTPLACEHFIQCTVDTGDHIIDLSPLVNSQGYFLATSLDDPTPFYINLCHPLNPIPGIRCPPGAAACKILGGNDIPISLGKVDQGPQIGDDKETVTVTYNNGDECPQDNSQKIKSIITLKCSKGLSASSPVMISYADCTYNFVWETNAVCPPSRSSKGKDCKYYNDVLDYEFDLSRLAEKQVSTSVSGVEYFIHLCKSITNGKEECADAAVCKKDGSEFKSLGNLATQQFVFEGQMLKVTYTDGSTCGHDDDEKRQTTIIFKCAETEQDDNKLAFFSVDRKCNYVFQWTTSLACPPMAMPCDLSYQTNIFDLQPLSQITGSWQFTDSNKNTYYMNLCQPAYNTPDECPREAAVCRKRADDSVDVLGMVYTQQLRAYGKAASPDIIMRLAEGDPEACDDGFSDDATSTEVQIIFKCAHKVGHPIFHNRTLTTGKACRFTFLWESKVACPEERIPVTIKNGKIKDTETDRTLDLNPLISHGSWMVEGDSRDEKTGVKSVYRYYINLDDKVLPVAGDKHKDCKKSAVCQTKADGSLYRGIGNIDSKKYFIEGEILEIEITSPTSCNQRDTEDVISTIVLQCDTNGQLGEPKFLYESSNCQYYFEWVTSAVCDSAQANQPKGPSAGGGGLEKSKHTQVSTVIGVLIGIVLLCVLVIVFHKKDRRTAVYWKLRKCLPGAYSNVPAYSYSQLSSGDSEENLIGLNSTRGLFNSDDDEDEELLKDTRTNPHEFHDDSDEEILPNV